MDQSETYYQAIFDALPDLMVRLHRDGTYLDIKPATTFPTDLPNFRVGANIRQVLSGDTLQGYLEAMDKALHSQATQIFEYPLLVQGQPLWQEARIVPLSDDQVLIVVRDLTDHKRAEMALQDSESRFRQLAEAVQQGFFVYESSTGQYSYQNPAYWEICGIEPGAGLDGMGHWLARIHPEDRLRIEAALEREQQGEPFDQEYRYITPDGELRWLRSRAFPLGNPAEPVTRIVGTVENITDRKVAEAALQQSEERFRCAFEKAPYAISLVSSTGQFVMANAYYCNLLGYSEA
ncbi:MAG TPA: PAS domain S-box protein, partial [Leptolyngbyaceae cyanobacterium M65_K2018_010]|nr:PAS domain S-box protein [Leptolyngbyaceae cyanobacterium M65_K2018_010]